MTRIFHRLAANTGAGRSRGLLVTMSFSLLLILVTVIWGGVQLVPLWVTSWQGAHGHYPTGHLNYAVPNGWNTTTLTGLSIKNPGVWWDVFDDTVTATSPTYAACYTPPCAVGTDRGARLDMESAAGRGQPTIEAWYQTWADATARRFGTDVVLPLADYTRVSLGGQSALCAANQTGSQMLPPYPPSSSHFAATFPGYAADGGAAVVMCFVLWQGRAYYVQGTVQLHTATQAADLRNAARMLNSLHFA